MVLDRPDHFLAHVGPKDLGREAVMVLRRQSVADVVKQGGHHPVDVRAFV